jgi:hypothetical protein
MEQHAKCGEMQFYLAPAASPQQRTTVLTVYGTEMKKKPNHRHSQFGDHRTLAVQMPSWPEKPHARVHEQYRDANRIRDKKASTKFYILPRVGGKCKHVCAEVRRRQFELCPTQANGSRLFSSKSVYSQHQASRCRVPFGLDLLHTYTHADRMHACGTRTKQAASTDYMAR